MYEGSNGSFHTLQNGDEQHSNSPPAQSSRRRYSKEELIRLRSLSTTSSSFVQYLRANLGPIASVEAANRWASKASGDTRFACRDARSTSNSIASSPPSAFDDRLFQRDPFYSDVTTKNSNEYETLAPLSAPRAVDRVFQTSPDAFLPSKLARSPPSKRTDVMFSRPDGNGSVASMSPTHDLASSPTESMFHGTLDYRRRSPSPRASPIASPRRSPSPSGPPGFGPPAKSQTNQVPRGPTNGKVRICKGPNMGENFATRIAYKKRQKELQNAAGHKVKPSNGIEDVQQKSDLIDMLLKAHEKVEGAPNSLPGLINTDKPGPSFEVKKPPQFNYSISTDISFDDFSKRLAAETAGNAVLENKFESDIIASLELDRAVVHDQKPDVERAELYPGQNGQNGKRNDTDKEAMDELSKWFRSIAATLPGEGDEGDAPGPESSVEGLKAQAPLQDERSRKEGLDSGVLSFFDSIRTQALSEENGAENDNNPGEPASDVGEYDSSQTSKLVKDENNRLNQGFNDYDATEVEQFFQLFTAGKPVYGSDLQRSNDTKQDVSKAQEDGFREHNAQSSSSNSVLEPDADTKGLERWFAALASANHIQ